MLMLGWDDRIERLWLKRRVRSIMVPVIRPRSSLRSSSSNLLICAIFLR